jgi:hypothetical protein
VAQAVRFAVADGEFSFERFVLCFEIGDFGFVALFLGSEFFT